MSHKQTRKKSRTSFGATAPPFIDYLKEILCRYPDGGQILKELIQNADDAKATKVIFIHDERSYGTDSLWTEELQKYQGPALYAYNNAAFTHDDWEGIQMAGRSVKRNDPNTVGRFGIGFNSVYHTTDVPGIFSSGHLGFMDPQEKIFGERNGGFWLSLEDIEDQEVLMTFHDQFQPFRDVVSLVSGKDWSEVVMEDQHFDGTLFRFPLRKETSDISDNLYDSHKMVELFDSFIADADLSLLFLKSVISVSLMHIGVDGTVSTRLEVNCSVPADITLQSKDESVVESLTRFKIITLNSEDRKETRWLVTTCSVKEGNIKDLDVLATKLSFIPRVDLAFPCSEEKDCSGGRLSCFLPLPNNETNRTGLPVHVNACFGLTDNRRLIKWQEEDQKHDKHALWNELLMKEVLPQAYVIIIQDAIQLAQASHLPVSAVYNLWPDILQTQQKDKWHVATLDVFHQLFRKNVAVLSLAKDEREFITPSEAVFPCNGPTSTDILSAIRQTLVSRGENLVTLPASVSRAVNKAYPQSNYLKYVTPTFIREILHRTGVADISKDDKFCLLEFILGDGEYKNLEGLQLLPLDNGSFRSFSNKEEDTALIDSKKYPRDLLPCCKHPFISDDLNSACRSHLKEIANRNLFKVINIDADHVVEYTRQFLPHNWKDTRELVTWDTNNKQHPPLDWLQKFWRFINVHFSELSRFIDLPLIPINPLSASNLVYLGKLQHNTTQIFQKSKQSSLPDQVAQLVNKVGGTVVSGNDWLKHEDLDSYVLSPSPRSVLKVLMNLGCQHLIKKLTTVSHKVREDLKDYLSHLDLLTNEEKDFISKLPLFQTVKGSCAAAQSKQAVLLHSTLTLPTELPMPESVIKCATEVDHRLLKLLKVKILDTAEAVNVLISGIEKKACSNEDTKKIMIWVLQHGEILFSQNKSLKSKCKDLRFIEVNGELRKTSGFFDPRVPTFKIIFEQDFFPPPVYTGTPQMLQSLTELGLMQKEADVSPEHFLQATRLVDKMPQAEALKRAHILLEMLNTTDLLSKFSDKQLSCLKMLKWVPCVAHANEDRLLGNQSHATFLSCPDETRHSVFKDIVGYVMPLVGKCSERVSQQLGLKRLPPPEKVRDNLSVLINFSREMTDPSADVDFKRKLHCIYKHMQENINAFKVVMNKETRWLWNHNQFVSPLDLVLEYPSNLDLSSHIGKVSNEYSQYKTLLLEFGLRKSLSTEDIFGILFSIQQTIEARQDPFATSSEVKASIEILNWLWREKKKVPEDIPVPVIIEHKKFALKPGFLAVFCDVSKSGLKELQFSQEEIYGLHEEIPKATAEWLNVRLLSTYILDPELVEIEQCGQSEPITTRIKNIIKEYDEESDIFKELIQNAEDAGAGTCKFLVDFRQHKEAPETLIDPGMALCQGPCLWAFNNEQFTAADWDNIVKVGSASKENKVEKIGKFGLGFNTVYHVTDIPSILSGNRLLILDPNVTHLDKRIKHKSNPGIRLDLSQKRIFDWFPGQFGAYQGIFECEFTEQGPPEPYSGTLIKLPFRTEEEALKSEISSKVFHKSDINTLQQHFIKNSQTHLLFLKNVETLSLQNVSSNASTPPRDHEIKNILTVSKTTQSTMRISDETSVSKQRQAVKSLMKLDDKCKVIDCYKIKIVQITSQQSTETEVQSWLLYNCFGTEQVLKMAFQENKQAKFSLPIGGVAVPLQNNPETDKWCPLQTNLVGQAFCFLPLPIQTGLPVNVNGMFAVTSNRKGLWESGVKNDWNKALLEGPVLTAYITALTALKEMSENKQLEAYTYYQFWPDREKVSGNFQHLVDAFYSNLSQNSAGPELFSDGEHWCSMNNAIFLHESIEKDQKISTVAAKVCKEYVKAPNHVVCLPRRLRKSFKMAGMEKILQDRTWTWEKFYQEVVFRNIKHMDQKSRDTLVLHAINLHKPEIDSLLLCYPCIPTTDGQLQYITKLVNPSGRAALLFDQDTGRLLGGTKKDYCSSKIIQRLLDLGMANDHLTLEDITEKTSNLVTTWSVDKKKAYVHLRCLLELMKYHTEDSDSLHWKKLRTTAFLPAFSPGDAEMKNSVTLNKPTDVFSDRCTLLVNMTQPVLDHNRLKIHNEDPALHILGVQNSPGLVTVIQQLKHASEQSKSIDKSMLHKIALECYKFLDQWISDSGNTTFISEWANSFPFILIGHTFVNVSCVAECEQSDVSPYLHVLPKAFARYRNLWESIGVEKTFTIKQYLTVLQELNSKHGNKRLPQSDLSVTLTILNEKIAGAKVKTNEDCLIPNKDGVLQPASELCYDDSPWMPVSSNVTLCHDRIPRATARHFGIKTTRHYTLENCAAENISPFAFQFEQQEQLTVRIKNIISAYPSKKDILKELIQNADDAEATEIHFVWDKRKHHQVKTFGKKWNQLQGPALCVFNNKVFSDEDLHGIQQLGEGGKQSSPGKIGKYGVGFNSVYHLTDCPSILTGDKKLCISDPNQKYIECHSGKPPSGIGYNVADDFKKMYIDVYNSFLPEKFALEKGTMFRLPLRANASSSKISQQGVTQGDMEELFAAFSEDPEGLIMFLKNICKITVHEINDDLGKLKTIFVVDKSVPEKSKHEKDVFAKRLQNALHTGEPVKPHRAFYTTVISTSNKRQSTWIVAEQFGCEIKSTDKLPHVALAACMKSTPYKSISMDFYGQAFCSLPLPGKTGLPVHVNGNFEVDASRKNLWKEDGQSLKSDWNEALKQKVIAPLYAALLHHIRSKVKIKKVLFGSVESYFNTSYLCFWPTVTKDVGKDWHEMIHEVYRAIENQKLDVIPVMRSSTETIANTEIRQYSFDWYDISGTGSKALYLSNSSSHRIDLILEDLGMKLVPYSTQMHKIWDSFKSAGIQVKDISPTTVQNFLRTAPLNDPAQTMESLPLPISATLIKNEERFSKLLSFCLTDLKHIKKLPKDDPCPLHGLPLLLTGDKVLRLFNSNSPRWMSRYEDLFSGYHEHFADYNANIDHIDLLKSLSLVKEVTVPDAVKLLKPIVEQLLVNCEVDLCSGLHVPNDVMLKWLKWLWMYLIREMKSETFRKNDKSVTLDDVRKLFSDSCIVPVMCPRKSNKKFLKTMKDMSSVVQNTLDGEITEILYKLGFMKLDSVFFSDMIRHLPLHTELLNEHDKSSVLEQVYKINHSEFSQLSSEEIGEFQDFLQSGLSKAKDSQQYERKLRSLPIFETIDGERVRIDGPKEIFVLNCSYSRIFPDLFNLSKNDNIFLQNSTENMTLSNLLKLQVLTDLDYFMKFILPAVHSLTEKQTLHCLKLVLLLELFYPFNQHSNEIFSKLKTVKIIRSSQGKLETASFYFDDSVKLYKMMLPPEKFVPSTFWTELCGGEGHNVDRAKELIRKLGMKHVVSDEDFINFAHQLECDAKLKRNVNELRKKSETLFYEALKEISDNKKEGLLNNLANISFVFPVKIRKELCDYHQPFAADATAVKIRGSLIKNNPEHQDLIWSSMPIILVPLYMSEKMKQMMKNAGAHIEPPTDCVTHNLRNICESLCNTENLITTRAAVFRSSYTYLQAKGFKEQELAGFPLVLVEKDTELSKADVVCLSVPNDLEFRPYLYKVHPKDIKFEEFFKKIGVQDKPTAVQYCNVLAAVYEDSCDKLQLQKNQTKTIKRAVEQLFKTLQTEGSKALEDEVKTLYLPAVDGKLYPSFDLYYNDTVYETNRVEEAVENEILLLEKLSNCFLGNDIYEHQKLLQLLPQTFKPKMLSEFTSEKAVESLLEQCEVGLHCEFRKWFEDHLSSGAFRHGLICLIRHQSEGKTTHEEATVMCEKIFGSIQIICCKTLETQLWLGEQELQKTASETDVYVERGRQSCIFYLKHSDENSPKVINEVNMTLTKEINACLGNRIAAIHFPLLGQLLMCDNLQDVQKALAKNNIKDIAGTEKVCLDPPGPGTDIPEEWHDSLDMDILNNFEEGEFVGYSINDKYIYAVIVQEIPGDFGSYSRRYKIDIGEDLPTEVSCLDLFQFKRDKKPKPGGQRSAESFDMQLQLLTGAAPRSSQQSTRPLPDSLEEAKREIDKYLAEIWILPAEEKQKAIKRLYLRWHPDKNPDSELVATEAFKYLLNRIEELTTGKKQNRSPGSSHSGWHSDFRNFYQQWNQEARYHRSGRERHFRGYHSYNFWGHNTNIPKPNKKEAQRWLRQAQCDLAAASSDEGRGSTEWCLFKVHQAVEKSLIAAEYRRNGNHPSNSSISAIAAKISRFVPQLSDLPEIVNYLKSLGVDAKKTQYPNCHPYPHIPNEQFKPEHEKLAVNEASRLLNKVELYVN